MKTKTLKHNEWLSLKKIEAPEYDVGGYVYSHEERCNGNIVCVLPFKFEESGEISYLLRNEVTPCWKINEPVVSSITGGIEDNQSKIDCALNELYEEAGYKANIEDLVYLGYMYGTKSSDTHYHLFIIDLTDYVRYEATGDGSELEAKAYCFWSKSIEKAKDPFVYVLYEKIRKYYE